MNGEAMMWASLDNELELMKEGDSREYKCADCIFFYDSFLAEAMALIQTWGTETENKINGIGDLSSLSTNGYGFCENADSDYAYVEKNKSCCCKYKSKKEEES